MLVVSSGAVVIRSVKREAAAPVKLVGPEKVDVIADLGGLSRQARQQQKGAQEDERQTCRYTQGAWVKRA